MRKRIKESLNVGEKYQWSTADEWIGGGNSSRVTKLPDHPGWIAVATKSKLKRDWYAHLGLLDGEAKSSDGRYVLILPEMEHASSPEWYNKLGQLLTWGYRASDWEDVVPRKFWRDKYKADTKTGAEFIRFLLKSDVLDRDSRYWCNTILSFFQQYPQWENNRSVFDMQDHNLMSYNGTLFMTDPIEEVAADS